MAAIERVVVVGASGFGRECLDVLEAMVTAGEPLEIVGVLDDFPSEVNLGRLRDRGVSFLGGIDEWLSRGGEESYLLGIGSPQVREKLVRKLDEAGARAFTAMHPSATVGAASTMAEGVVVCAGVCISNNVHLARHVHVNPNATLGHDADLGEFVSINPGAIISGEVFVGALTLVGAGAIVLQQLSVGERTVVGAGAVVTKDVGSDVVVVGIPAR